MGHSRIETTNKIYGKPVCSGAGVHPPGRQPHLRLREDRARCSLVLRNSKAPSIRRRRGTWLRCGRDLNPHLQIWRAWRSAN
jgi:hypothetical protein